MNVDRILSPASSRLAPGGTRTYEFGLFLGPKFEEDLLAFEAAERDATVDAILGLGDEEPSGLLADLDEESSAPAPGHQVAGRPVESTVDRSGLWQVQTPQLFEIQLLRRAYAEGDPNGATDDAMLVERLGEPVVVVEGDQRNLKVTTPMDLQIAHAIAGISGDQGRPAHKRF